MQKTLMIVLIILWVFVIAVSAVNLYRQYVVHSLQKRILKDYQDLAAVPSIYKDLTDSLQTDIKLADSLFHAIDKPFPLKNKETNWLLIRLSVILLTVCTALSYWLYYKKQAED